MLLSFCMWEILKPLLQQASGLCSWYAGSTSALNAPHMQLQSRAKCYRIFPAVVSTPPPLLCSSRLGEITLIVVKCDGNGKSLKGSPALPQHKELNLDRNEDSSLDNTNYMCGGAGNGHARCSASFTHAAVLVCWLYLMSNAFCSPQRLRQHCATADLASAKPPECPDCWLGCQRELPGITRSVRLAFELTQRDPGKMVWSSTQTPHHRWSACITVWPPNRVSAVQLDVG